MTLYHYGRSSASYRVRIALHLKGIDYTPIEVRLGWTDATSEHTQAPYLAMNPQGLVPMLVHDGVRITQSLAILDHLDRQVADPPLFPSDAAGRARVLGLVGYIAADVQPLQNLRVERYVTEVLGGDGPAWRRHWIEVGFAAIDAILDDDATGRCCHGDTPGAADAFLIPQALNARRLGIDLGRYPAIAAVVAHCGALPAFAETAPGA